MGVQELSAAPRRIKLNYTITILSCIEITMGVNSEAIQAFRQRMAGADLGHKDA